MKRVFVYQDFKSQKFWSIDVRGTDVIVNYGKLGTDGQTQVKNFSSAGEADKNRKFFRRRGKPKKLPVS